MTSLNNQELEQKTDELMKRLGWVYKPNKGGTYYWQKFNGVHKSQMTLSEARLLTELFESELANRERVAESRIAKSLHDRIFNDFDMLPRIQTAYTGDRNIDVRKLQKVICEFRDDLQNLPVYGD